jgi:hypothetical protein
MDKTTDQVIIDKFKAWKAQADRIFDVNKYIHAPEWRKRPPFHNAFTVFNSLEDEIKLLPNNDFLHSELLEWVKELDFYLKADIKTGSKILTALFQEHRIILKERLLKIKSSLSTEISQVKEVLEVKEPIQHESEVEKETPKNANSYSHKQIAIAYCITGEAITSENAAEILNKYSETKSVDKLLQKRIYKLSDLSKLSENKTTDTKHLNDLKAAKRLLSGRKNKKAVSEISHIITAFEAAYQNHY